VQCGEVIRSHNFGTRVELDSLLGRIV